MPTTLWRTEGAAHVICFLTLIIIHIYFNDNSLGLKQKENKILLRDNICIDIFHKLQGVSLDLQISQTLNHTNLSNSESQKPKSITSGWT